jgi:hypothetical protein
VALGTLFLEGMEGVVQGPGGGKSKQFMDLLMMNLRSPLLLRGD